MFLKQKNLSLDDVNKTSLNTKQLLSIFSYIPCKQYEYKRLLSLFSYSA